jgi:predicted Fe-Mo cluster-binding NifX family protein
MAMKIAVSAAGPSLDDLIDPRFGRCVCFLIVETDTLEFEVLENAGKSQSGGAGIEAAQQIADQGVSHVLTGYCGPNAEKVLSAAGIWIVSGCAGTVREAVERFRSGKTASAEPAPASRRTGASPPSPSSLSRPAPGRPAGYGGRGSGRGMGRRQGMGRRCGR